MASNVGYRMHPGPYIAGPTDPLPNNFDPDVVIVGAGLVGCALAARLITTHKSIKVLVLDAGPWVAEDHGQSTGVGSSIRDRLSVEPFQLADSFGPTGFISAVGGCSLAWTAWSPRPRPTELANWPTTVVASLHAHLADAEALLNVTAVGGDNRLGAQLIETLHKAAANEALPAFADGPGPAPIGLAPAGHAISPVADLARLVRADHAAHQAGAPARIQVISRCRLICLEPQGSRIRAMRTSKGMLTLRPGCAVVLAANTIESARQILLAQPGHDLAGTRLSGHVLSSVALRTPLPRTQSDYQWSTLLMPGASTQRHTHLQLRVVAGLGTAAAELPNQPPGLYGDELFDGSDEQHMLVYLTAIGEMPSRQENVGTIRLSPDRTDEHGLPVTHVHFDASIHSDPVWALMDEMLEQATQALATPQTRYGTPWERIKDATSLPPAISRSRGGRRWDKCIHASGSLWLAESADQGVTGVHGAVYGFDDLYATGLSLYPNPGSHNGGLAAVALALNLADHLIR